jgi:hypothetical protein
MQIAEYLRLTLGVLRHGACEQVISFCAGTLIAAWACTRLG